MAETIVLITGSKETKETLAEQLEELVGDFVTVKSYAVEEDYIPLIEGELVIFSSRIVSEEAATSIGTSCSVLVASRVVNFHALDALFDLPHGTEILYVNDLKETVHEAIHSLKEIGVDHLHFYPYYPGKRSVKTIPLAVTPGEVEKVPEFVERIINIKPRLIDMATMIDILNRLDLLEAKHRDVSVRYLQRMIHLNRRIALMSQESKRMAEHLQEVVNGVHDGILAVNADGVVTVFNGILEQILQVDGRRAIGRSLTDIILDPELQAFVQGTKGDQPASRFFTVEETDVMVHAMHIDVNDTTVVTFKNVGEALEIERRRQRDLKKKGHYAKFTFQDIVGKHPALLETKSIAKKLAKSDLTILIQGESGTGKELFASSMHHESPRKDGPFLAVNFSALPEDLVESELFGYDEGAFTGARKGGKKGLFEQADGGTIFLDEIGDISLKVQARLLRVLQEKELLRVGGAEIIPVDVRVIAATNKDLLKLMDEKMFREDLYHRLKVLFLHLPELRNRKEDLAELVQYFIHQSGRGDRQIPDEVIHKLAGYDWFGNIRELKNTIDYMLTVADGNSLTLQDIPNESFFVRPKTEANASVAPAYQNGPARSGAEAVPGLASESFVEEKELMLLLEVTAVLQDAGKTASRKAIREQLRQLGEADLTEQQIRYRMNLLQERGLLTVFRGRIGAKLNAEGYRWLDEIIN
ncbi:sigma-54 interaction domain-containing protein [Salisediminibacterium beveridgei]|uniref:Fis family transcriptional regulator n=1 Tax=Salisediminibacterium beveridgei TaxID=632773 RepID=A0A1D7QS35_9BACI|nr:sigma 54-interacting transcriptional regulator [Salisediminibacterium beveridgei]AOM81824.1 Fis family transcriptional regulator [Salisediminibacterium beveridgei]